MSIVKCSGPQAQPGFRHVDERTGEVGECHLYDPEEPATRAGALRAAARDSNRVASKGDERMMRDG